MQEQNYIVFFDRNCTGKYFVELSFTYNKVQKLQQILLDKQRNRKKTRTMSAAPLPNHPELIQPQGNRVSKLNLSNYQNLKDYILGAFDQSVYIIFKVST